jgi:ABC-2 type transport system ATP-binding protein
MSVLVEARQLTRRFGELLAVDHIDLAIERETIFGLLGPNGAGKSTTIKMLTTLLPPSEGTASIAGVDIRQHPARVRRHIGYVPQLVSADGALTGYENLLLSARLYGIPRAERRSRIVAALSAMELSDAARRLVNTYSGGMVRRLELAQATLHRPELLILDEPTIGLDPVARHGVWESLLVAVRDSGVTVLLTTHDMEEATALCGTVALMEHGRIAATGTPGALAAAIGPTATLEDVFTRYTEASHVQPGDRASFRSLKTERRNVQRLG